MSERFYGLYKGICVNNNDPEGLNRIIATCPTVFTDPTIQSDWAWPIMPPGIAVSAPLPNSGVWLGFEGGDAQYPYWAGVWSNDATVTGPYDPLGSAAAAQAAAEAFATSAANAAQAASDPLGSATAAEAAAVATSEAYTNSQTAISPPNARAFINSAQNLAAVGYTKVAIDTISYDATSLWNLSTHRCTPKVAGLYEINFSLEATLENNPQVFFGTIYKNGSLNFIGTRFTIYGGSAGDIWGSTGSDLVRFNGSTDYMELFGYNGGGNVMGISVGSQTYVSCIWGAP